MRRSLAIAGFAFTVVTAAAIAAAPYARTAASPPLPGNLEFRPGLLLSPRAMPARTLVPATAGLFARIATKDGTHPSALRELALDLDKDVKLEAEGAPACKPPARTTSAVRKACGSAIVGAGTANIEFAFPEQKWLIVPNPLTVVHGGTRNGETTLYLHTFVTIPTPAAVVAKMTIRRFGSGLRSLTRIPPIAGGAGSLIDFRVKLGRRYYDSEGEKRSLLMARCPDGVFRAAMPKVVFRNEAKVPNVAPTTILKGSVLVPCTPKG